MNAILDDWNTLVNQFTKNVRAYLLNRERRLIALVLIKGGTISDIAKIIDPKGPQTPQAIYFNHPASEINKVKEEVEKNL